MSGGGRRRRAGRGRRAGPRAPGCGTELREPARGAAAAGGRACGPREPAGRGWEPGPRGMAGSGVSLRGSAALGSGTRAVAALCDPDSLFFALWALASSFAKQGESFLVD